MRYQNVDPHICIPPPVLLSFFCPESRFQSAGIDNRLCSVSGNPSLGTEPPQALPKSSYEDQARKPPCFPPFGEPEINRDIGKHRGQVACSTSNVTRRLSRIRRQQRQPLVHLLPLAGASALKGRRPIHRTGSTQELEGVLVS